MSPWLIAVCAVALTLSLISLLVQKGAEFTAKAGAPATFHAAPTFPTPTPLERYPTAVIASAPVLYYRMNENGGTTATDSAPSPNGTRPGYYYGNPQLRGNTTGEPIGSDGANFPSGSCITSQQNWNQAFVEGGPGSVPMGPTGTLEFLAKGAQSSNQLQTLVYANRNSSNYLRLFIDANSVLELQYTNAGTTTTLNFNGYTLIYPTTWTHYAVTWNYGSFTLYVNGGQVGDAVTMDWLSPSAFITGADICNGNWGITTFGNTFTGTLSNIAYYNRVLPQSELSAHALAAGIPQIPSGWTYITNVATGLVIDSSGQVPNTYNPGSNLKQWSPSAGSANFGWRFESLGGGYYRVYNRTSGLYFDALNPPTAGQRPVQAGWRGTSDIARQQWSLNNLGGGRYQIINRQSGLALDGHGITQYLDNQAFVYLEQSAPGNANQQWTITASP